MGPSLNSAHSTTGSRKPVLIVLAGLLLVLGAVHVPLYLGFGARPFPFLSWLAIMLCGLMLLVAAAGFRRPLPLAGVLAVAIGLAAVVVRIEQGWGLGQVDALPGFMGVSALLAGAAFLAMGTVRNRQRRLILVISCGAVICVLAVAGLLSDLFPGILREPSRLGVTLSRMSLLLLLGIGLVELGRPQRVGRRDARRMIYIPLVAMLAAATMLLAHILRTQEVEVLQRSTMATMDRISDQVGTVLDGSLIGLDRMAQSWMWRGQPDQNDWNTDTWVFVDHYPEVHAVAWVDPEFRVQWLTPLAGNHEWQGIRLDHDATRRDALRRAFNEREVAVSGPLQLLATGEWGFHVHAPIRAGRGIAGFITGFYRLEPLLDDVVRNVAPGYTVRMMHEGETIYRSGAEEDWHSGWAAERVIDLYGAQWRVAAAPDPVTLGEELTWLPGAVFGFGLLMALLLAIALYNADANRMAARRLAYEVRRRSRIASKLRQTQRELESRVAERTADLHAKQEELEQINRELERLATTDPLTGVANRRRFLEQVEQEVQAARRYGRDLSLIMLDLDRFKRINDLHGHQVGDEVLLRAAKACEAELRATDSVARYGGEEFVILLTETSGVEAMRVAERLRQRIEAASVDCGDGEVDFTASLGVTAWRASDRSIDTLLERADRALYRAKDEGRNRAVWLEA